MAVDVPPALLGAVVSAFEDARHHAPGGRNRGHPRSRRLGGTKAVLLGAGLATAGRWALRSHGSGLAAVLERYVEDGDE